MARGRKNSQIDVELFPFLSVLTCVVGVLTLMIAGMVLGQMDSSTAQAIERAEQHEQLQQQIEQHQQEKEDLQQTIARADELEQEVQQARQKLEDRRGQIDTAAARAREMKEEITEYEAGAEDLRQQIARLESDLENTRSEIEKLEQEIAERNKPPEAGDVVIQPGGTGEVNQEMLERTIFMECRQDGLVAYKDFDGEDTVRFSKQGIKRNLEFIAVVDDIAVNEEWMVLLVRPDGWQTARRVEDLAKARGAYHGKLPVPGDGQIDLGVFKQLLQGAR